MPLTAKTRIALNSLVDLVLHGQEEPMSMPMLAERQGVSVSYLEQLFSGLRRAGIIGAVRGPGGGYQVQRPLATITIADVFSNVEDRADASFEPRSDSDHSAYADKMWSVIHGYIQNYLGTITLYDVIKLNALPIPQPPDETGRRIVMERAPSGDGLVTTKNRKAKPVYSLAGRKKTSR